jgi:coenzyme F420-0:L-glutamate ligase/coenzyme F420-1:gamma-L-glutamate ligase
MADALPGPVRIAPIGGMPEVGAGFGLGEAIARAAVPGSEDIVVISQKVVSKAEGRVVDLAAVEPGSEAAALASDLDRDPRLVELILAESRSVVRADRERGILITETAHGFICANAGIDSSNSGGPDRVVLLPEDPDRSARQVREAIEKAGGERPAVVVSDSFGRAWRIGQVEVAIGCAGLDPLDDWRGRPDSGGRELTATEIGIADQVAAAADLARDKTSRTPAVVVEGLGRFVRPDHGPGCAGQIRPSDEDLFR